MIYQIYGLIHPISNKICYIGYSTQKLKTRLTQHNNPKDSNMSKIAKLRRSLKKQNLKLSIVLLKNCSSEEEMYKEEIFYISFFKKDGFKLYNLQDGGKLTGNPLESYIRSKKSRVNNEYFYKDIKGEKHHLAILSEKDVLKIYTLIKSNYSNEEIFQKLKLKCSLSAIKAVRRGQTWKHLWEQHFTIVIKSLFNRPGSYESLVKLKIIDLITKNYELIHINKHFSKISISDLKRIKEKQIWKPIWVRYSAINE